MTAVEWLADEIIMLEEKLRLEEININDFMDAKDELVSKALEMEKENLIDMSVKSALHERKWLYENMSGKEYKPTKVEIRDLQETALEHYNITFK
jgi:predicted RNA-binding protein with RPS1 domain